LHKNHWKFHSLLIFMVIARLLQSYTMKKITLFAMVLAFCCPAFAIPPVITSFAPGSAAPGMTVTITGTDFTGATEVSFGGTPAASFTVVSSTQIKAVVALGTSGNVSVTTVEGNAVKSGFTYIPTSGIITDFNGWWLTTGAAPNATNPDDSHNLLAFTYSGITYSTGINNAALASHGITYTPGSYKALPVAGISGVSGTIGSNSTYLALARKIDGSTGSANAAAVSGFSVKQALVDGPGGLNLGSGVTNLPPAAILTFQVFNISEAAINDAEPDILLTQIAQPVAGNDQYSFIDGSGNVVGNTITVDMTLLPSFGSYTLDLFNLAPSTPYNAATPYSSFATNTSREIRLTGLRLTDFGITGGSGGNVSQIRALKITPSGNSDYAFIAYNTNSLNLPPNISQDLSGSNTTVCAGGTTTFSIVASPAMGGALLYSWERSVDGGTSWTAVSDGGSVTGAATHELSVTNPAHNNMYRALVTEAGNPVTATSPAFTVTISTPAPPSAVSVSGTSATCPNSQVQLSATVTGGSNLFYQWQSNASGSYNNIADANMQHYLPPVNLSNIIGYRVMVTSGNGCAGAVTSVPIIVAVTAATGGTGADRCGQGTLQLSGTANSGTVDWYAASSGGSSLFTGPVFTTPTLLASKTYYISASGCSSASRIAVTATVKAVPQGGNVTGGGLVNAGNNSTTLTLTSYTGTIQNWESSTDGFVSDVTPISNTTNQLQVTDLVNTTSYRATVTNGVCPAFSGSSTIFTNGTLPVRPGSLTGKAGAGLIRVSWSGFSETNTAGYELEKSTDGVHFLKIHSVEPVSQSGTNTYSFDDLSPVQGHNYYRVKEIMNSGSALYTAAIDVRYERGNSTLSVFPNPVTGRTLNVKFDEGAAGTYQVQLVNQAGQMVLQENVRHGGGSFARTLQIPGSVPAGVYHLRVSGGTMKSGVGIVIR
jgi:hypothetical protein